MEHPHEVESDSAPEPMPIEAPPKRKRGRPPKNQAAAAAAQTPTTQSGADGSTQPAKRGRGRPPKKHAAGIPPAAAQTPARDDAAENISQPVKRGRGRPPGTKNKFNSSASNALVPHVVTVNVGEDVYEKLRDLSTSTRRSVVVLAATGLLSAATLMQLNSNGEAVGVTLKGTFTILGLSGALLQNSNHSGHANSAKPEPSTQFLSASLANPSGGVIGGTVAGALEAASPVIVVVGHWDPDRGSTSSDADQALSPQGAGAAAAQVGLTGLLEAAVAAGAGGLLLGLAGLPGQAEDWPDQAAAEAGDDEAEAGGNEAAAAQAGDEEEDGQQEEEDQAKQGSGGEVDPQDGRHANGVLACWKW